MQLFISNKPYSPWPFRVWLLMRTLDIPFEERLVDLSQPDRAERLRAVSPSGRVPVLVDADVTVWESTAIIEHLHERMPDKGIWPRDAAARAHARSTANEMHSGFAKMRGRLVMNMRREPKAVEMSDDVLADIDRLVAIWTEARARFGAGGPFLYGAFCAADAMYAPIVSRFHGYDVPVPAEVRAYMDEMRRLPGWIEWTEGSFADPWHNERTDAIS